MARTETTIITCDVCDGHLTAGDGDLCRACESEMFPDE